MLMRPSNGDVTQLDGIINLVRRKEVRARDLHVGVLSMYVLLKSMDLDEMTLEESCRWRSGLS